jgi:hypothetical protein
MKQISISIFLITLIGFTSCKIFKKQQTDHLPNEPKEIKILWEKENGMIGESESIYLSSDTCGYIYRKGADGVFFDFKIPQKKLMELYTVFVSNQFQNILTEKKDVSDRGGSKITLTVDGLEQTVDNSGNSFVLEENLQRYIAIENAILKTAQAKIEEQQKTIFVDLDQNLKNSKYILYVYVNNKEVYNELDQGEYKPVQVKLFDTKNTFRVLLMEKGSTFNTVIGTYEVTIDKLPISKKMTLTLVDNNLTIK